MRHGISRALGVGTFWGIVAVTVWLFYFDGFTLLLSNESASLPVEVARARSRAHRDAAIIVLGNSTAAEDFHAEWFHAHSPDVRALNLGIPGGHVYLFERMLSLAMREGVQPRKIILTTTPEVLSLRPNFSYLLNDLMLLKTVVGREDLERLTTHTQDSASYLEYASRVAIRPALYHSELRDVLLHPARRLDEAARVRQYLADLNRDTPAYESSNSFSLCGIGPLAELNEKIRRLEVARDPAANDYAKVQVGYAVRAGKPLEVDAFETQRFRHLLRALAAVAPVYVIAAPVYDPEFEQYRATYRARSQETIRKVAAGVAGVTVLPDFEADCSMFADTVHLNRNGGQQFTEYLRTRVL